MAWYVAEKQRQRGGGSLSPKPMWPTGIIPWCLACPWLPFAQGWVRHVPNEMEDVLLPAASSQHHLLSEPLWPFPILPHRLDTLPMHSACTETPALRDRKSRTWRTAWLYCSYVMSQVCQAICSLASVPGKYWIDCTCSEEGCGMKPSSRTDGCKVIAPLGQKEWALMEDRVDRLTFRD